MKQLTTVIPAAFNKLRQSSQFLSVMGYTNEWEELSNFGIVFHIDYFKAVQKAINIWWQIKPQTDLEKRVRSDLIDSYRDTLNGHSRSFSAHAYDRIVDADGKLIKGIKFHSKTQTCHLFGFVVHKVIVRPGNYPSSYMSDRTFTKRKLLDLTPLSKFRQYILASGKFDKVSVEKLTFTQQDILRKYEAISL